jgi:hypothetical protein
MRRFIYDAMIDIELEVRRDDDAWAQASPWRAPATASITALTRPDGDRELVGSGAPANRHQVGSARRSHAVATRG